MHDSIQHCDQVVDDWDRHWLDFSATAELSPATLYRRRLAFHLLGIDPRDDSARTLEIGSGTGKFAEELHARLPLVHYLGLELSRTGVEIASHRVPRAKFLRRDLLQPATPDEQIDFRATHALCSDVLEHLDDPQNLLRNAAQYMAPDCKLVVTVPGGWWNAFYGHIGHRRHYNPADLKDLLEKSGFEVERTYAAGFPFFNLYRMLVTLRGAELIEEAAREPSLLLRVGGAVFNALFRLNLLHPWGWQTLAVARYRGA
jgi:SAM-dependent methyltransferase